MRDICFIDKTFDSTQRNDFHLSVQISPDGLYFTILDLMRGKYVVLNGYNYFLKRPRFLLKYVKEIIEKESLLKLKYQSIEILYSTGLFTLVPIAFYSEKDSEKVLDFNNIVDNGFTIKRTFFPRAGAWCLYAIPQNLSEYLEQFFGTAIIRHNIFPLVENGLKNNLDSSSRDQVHLNFLRDYFEIAVLKGPKLSLCNQFCFQNERDILYNVLYVYDQLKLSTEESEIIIYGHLPQVSPVYHLMKKYIRKTSFAKLQNTFQYSYTFNQLPEHYFSSLLNLYKCE
jgi:hypothetical protein